CAIGLRNPVRQVKDDAGKESRLCNSKEDPRRIERPDIVHEHHAHRHDSPADQDPGDPPSCADALENQVARDFEEAVANEEQSRSLAKLRVVQPEIFLQRGRGESDVDAIEVGDHVTDEGEWNQPPDDAADDLAVNVSGSVQSRVSEVHRVATLYRESLSN